MHPVFRIFPACCLTLWICKGYNWRGNYVSNSSTSKCLKREAKNSTVQRDMQIKSRYLECIYCMCAELYIIHMWYLISECLEMFLLLIIWFIFSLIKISGQKASSIWFCLKFYDSCYCPFQYIFHRHWKSMCICSC